MHWERLKLFDVSLFILSNSVKMKNNDLYVDFLIDINILSNFFELS